MLLYFEKVLLESIPSKMNTKIFSKIPLLFPDSEKIWFFHDLDLYLTCGKPDKECENPDHMVHVYENVWRN